MEKSELWVEKKSSAGGDGKKDKKDKKDMSEVKSSTSVLICDTGERRAALYFRTDDGQSETRSFLTSNKKSDYYPVFVF